MSLSVGVADYDTSFGPCRELASRLPARFRDMDVAFSAEGLEVDDRGFVSVEGLVGCLAIERPVR